MFYFKDKVILTYVVYEKQRIDIEEKAPENSGFIM